MRRRSCFVALAFIAVTLITTVAYAVAPQTITYQGRLTTSAGDPVADGGYLVKFIIYDAPTGGTALWNAGFQNVTTANGLFSYALGSNVAFPNNLFADTGRWLGITIGADPELSPRIRISSQAYANQAISSDTAGIAATVFDNSITGAKIVNGSIGSAKVANNSLTASDLAPNSVGASEITDGSVGAAEVDVTQIQRRVTGTAGAGEAITSINSDGTVGVTTLGSGDITDVIAGSGLTGGGTSGAVTVGVGTGAITAAHLSANCVSSSSVINNSLTAADLAAGSVKTSEISDGSVGSADIDATQVQRRVTGTAGSGTAIILESIRTAQ